MPRSVMAEIVNLRQARKALQRARAASTAEANRARFGQGKAQRTATRMERDRQERTLDGARREPD